MRQGLTIFAILTLTTVVGQVDTLDFKMNADYQERYVNGKKVDMKTYVKAKKTTDSLNDILKKSTFDHPAWIKRYHPNGTLSGQGFLCGECNIPVGLFITYYDNGQINSKENYASITDKKELKKRKKEGMFNWCSVKNGSCYYYDPKGQLKSISYYEMGKLMKCENYKDGKLVDTNCG